MTSTACVCSTGSGRRPSPSGPSRATTWTWRSTATTRRAVAPPFRPSPQRPGAMGWSSCAAKACSVARCRCATSTDGSGKRSTAPSGANTGSASPPREVGAGRRHSTCAGRTTSAVRWLPTWSSWVSRARRCKPRSGPWADGTKSSRSSGTRSGRGTSRRWKRFTRALRARCSGVHAWPTPSRPWRRPSYVGVDQRAPLDLSGMPGWTRHPERAPAERLRGATVRDAFGGDGVLQLLMELADGKSWMLEMFDLPCKHIHSRRRGLERHGTASLTRFRIRPGLIELHVAARSGSCRRQTASGAALNGPAAWIALQRSPCGTSSSTSTAR